MKLCLISGNHHIFSLMIQNHYDSRIRIIHSYPLDYDLVLIIKTSLPLEKTISILKEEFRYSPVMYLCPLFRLIPYDQRKLQGMKVPMNCHSLQFV